jgi:hypothetical protein
MPDRNRPSVLFIEFRQILAQTRQFQLQLSLCHQPSWIKSTPNRVSQLSMRWCNCTFSVELGALSRIGFFGVPPRRGRRQLRGSDQNNR